LYKPWNYTYLVNYSNRKPWLVTNPVTLNKEVPGMSPQALQRATIMEAWHADGKASLSKISRQKPVRNPRLPVPG
jgi:hypothetical protein